MSFPWSRFVAFLTKAEGFVPWLYLDTAGFVTVGIGQMIPNAEELLKLHRGPLPFTIEGEKAKASAVLSAYTTVLDRAYLRKQGSRAYRGLTTCRVNQEASERLLRTSAERHLEDALASREFPKFDALPEQAQMAIADLAYNLGASKFPSTFPSFTKAINEGDWEKAKLESHRKDVGRRNRMVAELFDEIIKETKDANL